MKINAYKGVDKGRYFRDLYKNQMIFEIKIYSSKFAVNRSESVTPEYLSRELTGKIAMMDVPFLLRIKDSNQAFFIIMRVQCRKCPMVKKLNDETTATC